MNESSVASPARRESPPAGLVLSALAAIETSATFRRSSRHRQLLRHLVQRTLDGASGEIKESVLATEVFGRAPSAFDPRSDTTVRVELRRLRLKLDRYYAQEGAGASIVVRLEAGSYVPRFEARPGAPPPVLAVLPFTFATTSGVAADTLATAEMLTDEVVAILAELPGLRVIARSSVAASLARSRDVRDIGAALGASLVVEGQVSAQGARHRVSVKLAATADGTYRAAHVYDAGAPNEPSLVHRIVRDLVADLALGAAAAGTLARAARRVTESHEARDAWQRGMYLLRRQRADEFRRALALFDEATVHDPQFAPAHAGRAQAAMMLIGLAPTPDPALIDVARSAAAAALALDEGLAAAHGVEAFLAFAIDRDPGRAERAMLTELRLAPADAGAHRRYAWQLMFAGRFDEAEAAYDVAMSLDPLDARLRTHQGLLWFYRRDYARAAARFERVLEIEPDFIVAQVLLASAWLNAGQHRRALAAFRAIAAHWPDDSIGALGVVQALALAGRLPAARAAWTALLARFGPDHVGPYRSAIAHARLGDADAAFAALERAALLRDMNFVCVAVDPSFDALRRDARWPALVARHGVAQVGAGAIPAAAGV
ncbi:MAG: tetratricopeptide repeat protein [Proteobacteria bacterium]|nr:tetratricopeptide repeat protein [Pseudomonadota bacterium]